MKHLLVILHWSTMALVVAQEFWLNRYTHNILKIGLLLWVCLGTLFCLVAIGYSIGTYTPNMINSAIYWTKNVKPGWWRKMLLAVHVGVLGFLLVTGHWWCAAIFAWLWASAKIAHYAAKCYLKTVNVEGKNAVVPRLARN